MKMGEDHIPILALKNLPSVAKPKVKYVIAEIETPIKVAKTMYVKYGVLFDFFPIKVETIDTITRIPYTT